MWSVLMEFLGESLNIVAIILLLLDCRRLTLSSRPKPAIPAVSGTQRVIAPGMVSMKPETSTRSGV